MQPSWTNKISQKKHLLHVYIYYIIFFAGPTREIPRGQDVPSLPARVANLNTGFASSCPLVDSAM